MAAYDSFAVTTPFFEKISPPLGFRSIQAADLIGWKGSTTSQAFRQLIEAVHGHLGPSPVEERHRDKSDEAPQGPMPAETNVEREVKGVRRDAVGEGQRTLVEQRRLGLWRRPPLVALFGVVAVIVVVIFILVPSVDKPVPQFKELGQQRKQQAEVDVETVEKPSPKQKDEWRDPVTGMEFAWVPGDCFQMGSNEGRSAEKPVHEVCVDGFWMGKYEVTQGQWKKIMGNNPSHFKRSDIHPVEQVSWNEVQDFVRKLNAGGKGGFRLPTEAEWEYACRSGGKQEKYCGGNDVNRVAWHEGNSGSKTHPIGKKSANGLGLYDMSGNVWEWVEDWYGNYSKERQHNPSGPASGSGRVGRGGGWGGGAEGCRAAYRGYWRPGDRGSSLGFRLARTNP